MRPRARSERSFGERLAEGHERLQANPEVCHGPCRRPRAASFVARREPCRWLRALPLATDPVACTTDGVAARIVQNPGKKGEEMDDAGRNVYWGAHNGAAGARNVTGGCALRRRGAFSLKRNPLPRSSPPSSQRASWPLPS